MARRAPSALNILIGIDKPVGCTSHDVVARVRRAVGERRVGHAGTLDPLASGVMVVGIGQATRLLGQLALDTKSYIADIQFGYETTTDDAEGEPTREAACAPDLLEETYAARVLSRFIGSSMQVPPAYSAISVNGVRSYRRARAGDEIELPARSIEVREAVLLAINEREIGPCWTVAFTVSKGTYIRALARDIARAIGSAAHLAALRRTASGAIGLAACLSLDDLDAERARASALDPVAALGVKAYRLGSDRLDDVLCGRPIPAPAGCPHDSDASVAIVVGDELRALARYANGRLQMKTVFPQGVGGVRYGKDAN